MKPKYVRKLDTYMRVEPFGVLIDESNELKLLVDKARKLRTLPFRDKLNGTKELALASMENAYEGMFTHPDLQRRKLMESMVLGKHSLGEALKNRAGCCRYQGVLFFVLGYESDLGSRHLLQSADVNGRLHTVFNDVHDDGNHHRVNIFTESLKDKKYDYSRINPRVYENVDTFWPGLLFYSYQRRGNELVILESQDAHA